jgi:hypothetical protein
MKHNVKLFPSGAGDSDTNHRFQHLPALPIGREPSPSQQDGPPRKLAGNRAGSKMADRRAGKSELFLAFSVCSVNCLLFLRTTIEPRSGYFAKIPLAFVGRG